jgi:transposase
MNEQTLWVGVDVGRYFHAWCAIDSTGKVVWERRRVVNTTAAMRRALEQLRGFARGRALRFGVEEPGGNACALVRVLTLAEQTVHLAQPLRVHRFHLALGQPRKSDPYDAQVIAQFLRQNPAHLPLVRTGTVETQALRVLSRRLDALGKDLRRCLSRLRATLAEYAPEWLLCSVFSDWSSEAALSTLERYGRVSKLRRTPLGRLANALGRWTHGRFGAEHAQALAQAFAEVSLPADLEEAYAQVLDSLVAQIRALLAEKQRLLALVAAQGQAIPAMTTLQAELGYGVETSAIIVSEVGEAADFRSEPAFATYCGVTPLKRKSGTSQGSSRLSRFTNKRLLRAIYQTTVCVVRCDERCRDYYQRKLAGRSDARSKTTAMLALARHRTRRLYKLLRQAGVASSEAACAEVAPQLTKLAT